MSSFVEKIQECFSFLESDLDFRVVSSHSSNFDAEVVYMNETTGVKVIYEVRAAFVFVFICQLDDGRWVDNPQPLESDSRITCFDFNDALPENEKMKPAYEYGADSIYYDEKLGLVAFMKAFARRLERHGNAVLKGDFSLLSVIEKIIKERVV